MKNIILGTVAYFCGSSFMVHPVFFSKISNTFRFQTYKDQKEEIKRFRAKETKG